MLKMCYIGNDGFFMMGKGSSKSKMVWGFEKLKRFMEWHLLGYFL
jgi:hypothetical protein